MPQSETESNFVASSSDQKGIDAHQLSFEPADQNVLVSYRYRNEINPGKSKLIDEVQDILGESADIFKLQQQSSEQDESARKVLICDDCPFNIVAVQSLI